MTPGGDPVDLRDPDGLSDLGELTFRRPTVADHWGVLSVPTTFIIDPQGQPRRVNHGLTSRSKLAVQLAEFLPPQPPASAAEQLAAK